MARIRSWYLQRPVVAVLWTIAAVLLLVGTVVGAAQASDQPSFCVRCHEMGPYHEAWSQGQHAGVSCVECHVDSGVAPRVAHKFVALGELWKHVTDEPTFPMPEPTEVPDERCRTCHESVDITIAGLPHAEHAGDRDCTQCHVGIGHEVSDEALDEAGIFSPENAQAREAAFVARAGEGSDNIDGHVPTLCATCHDMKSTGCESCHEAGHDPMKDTCESCHAPGGAWVFDHPVQGSCSTCHEPPDQHATSATDQDCETCHTARGVDWVFTHPTQTDCTDCHERPEEHTNTGSGQTCESCHSQLAQSWAFAHPGSSANCTTCHARPANHKSGSCVSCHGVGTSWKFSHPGRSSTCTSCHTKPARHSSGSCTTCHGVGTSWGFTHPGSSANCTSCHARPSGHSKSSCTACHNTASWAFKHPSSASCASCHRAPSTHYGASCSTCHAPTRSWRSATFTHPRVPGGEHSYRSFSCASCHPGGYSSYNCTSCHGPSGPDDDDDD